MLSEVNVSTHLRQQKKREILLLQKLAFCALGILATICTMDPQATPGYRFQFLLPLSYSIAHFIFAPPFDGLGIGYQMLNIIWIIRYVLGPALIRLSRYELRHFYVGVSDSHLNIALVLMLGELWFTFFSCYFFYNRYKTRIAKESSGSRDQLKNVNPRTVFTLVLLSAVIIIFDRNVLSGYNFIFQDTFMRRAEGVTFGTLVMIVSWCKTIVTIFLIGKFGERDLVKPSKFNVLCALFITILSMSFFNGTSRNGLLIEGLAFVYLLVSFFPRYKKRILAVGFGGIFLLILSITLFRFYQTRILSQAYEIFSVNSLAHLLNAYFAGQQNVAIGVKTLALYGSEYEVLTVLKDFLANTVLLNKLVSNIPGTVQLYNFTFYGHTWWADQIAPTITQALGLFSFFGMFVPVILVWLVIKLDVFALNTNSVLEVFVGSFTAATLSFFMPGNLTIIATSINNYFIPLFMISKMSRLKLVFGNTGNYRINDVSS